MYKKVGETSGYLKADTDLYAVGRDKVSIGKGKRGIKLTVVGVCGTYYRVKTAESLVSAAYGGFSYVPKTKVAIPVVGVTLNKKKATIQAGKKLQLTATVSPTMADNKKVTWKSSNKKIASVNAKGEVTAKKAGRAVITVTSVDGKKSGSCEVTVTETKYGNNRKTISKPTLVVATEGMNKVELTISNLEEYNGFTLYLNGKKYKNYSCKKRRGATTKNLTKLKVNKKYKIKVRTFIDKGGKKTYSRMSDTHKYIAGRIDITANVLKDESITVSWGEVEDAESYQLYRSGKRNGKYKLIKFLDWDRESYTDKNVKLNKRYYYKVKPVYGKKIKGTSNIDYAIACKLKSATKYLAKKYPFVCTNKKKKINSYNINGTYPFVKYRFVKGKLEIHVYLEFVTYRDTGNYDAYKEWIYEKQKAAVQSEVSTDKYISMFKAGIKKAYKIKIFGGKGDFKWGVNFSTELVIHEKKAGKKYHAKQQFIEVMIGGECPNCTGPGNHWYHADLSPGSDGYKEYGEDVPGIYMPTHEQVRTNAISDLRNPDVEEENYGVTAAHELGHTLGLDDAYYADGYDRCADNDETGYEYEKKRYDNLMKSGWHYKKINANGIEMILKAVDKKTGMANFASQSFRGYADNKISPVIKDRRDLQTEGKNREENSNESNK